MVPTWHQHSEVEPECRGCSIKRVEDKGHTSKAGTMGLQDRKITHLAPLQVDLGPVGALYVDTWALATIGLAVAVDCFAHQIPVLCEYGQYVAEPVRRAFCSNVR